MGKILSRKDLISKIFWNKDLAGDLEPLRRLVVENLLVGLARIWRVCSFQDPQ